MLIRAAVAALVLQLTPVAAPIAGLGPLVASAEPCERFRGQFYITECPTGVTVPEAGTWHEGFSNTIQQYWTGSFDWGWSINPVAECPEGTNRWTWGVRRAGSTLNVLPVTDTPEFTTTTPVGTFRLVAPPPQDFGFHYVLISVGCYRDNTHVDDLLGTIIAFSGYDVGPPPPATPAIDVSLEAFTPDGRLATGSIALAQTTKVVVTIANTSEDLELTDVSFANDAPFVVDGRSPGGLEIVSGPEPELDPDMTLAPGAKTTFTYEVTATANGVVAGHSKVLAKDESGASHQDAESLRFDIADGAELTDDLGRYVIMHSMDKFLQTSFRKWQDGMIARGKELHRRLKEVLSRKERKKWFGNANRLPLTPFDFAAAILGGVSPEMIAARLPKTTFKGFTAEQLEQEYRAAFKTEVGKGVSQWVKGWEDLGASAQKGLQDTWSEVMLTSYSVFGTFTPDERAQFEAFAMTLMDGIDSSAQNLYNTIANEIPRWQENLEYLDEALDLAVADAFLLSPDIQAQMAKESEWRQNVLDMAQVDPVGFQRAWAERDAEIFNLGIPLIFDTVLGGGATHIGGAVVRGGGSAMMRVGKAVGILDESGNLVRGPKTAVKRSTSAAPAGPSLGEVAQIERQGNYLDEIEGATIVQSSDVGNVYELPNLAGVPETTIEAKAGILGELEAEFAAATGKQQELAEVLKPGSALRKADGVAKVEITPQKTGKPEMLDAGAPKEILAEASVWRNSVNPRKQPGFKNLSQARQEKALKEWDAANKRWAEWENPEPGSKTARLKECLGRRNTVPLDTEPNSAGLQRFVTAEFEEVAVAEGTAEARLIRIKHYEIEVRDMNRGGRVVNRKTVVDNLEVAAPQTPDGDAVALAKVVGRDEAGNRILAPFNREEREFFMPRYIDKNIKARKKPPGSPGAIPDAAEHGVTLVMDDASAQQAGKLLANYGVPFLPEGPGLAYLKRIAPFVSGAGATPEQIAATYHKLVGIVRAEGGFGQHAVIVTRDSRYLGEIPVASW